ncbi:MAG TPA: thioredoxin domain-containing protein [Polyangiaceae bacterium]|nr:thioredoxin domain-containing protein [Polyangiaceae bacterium]
MSHKAKIGEDSKLASDAGIRDTPGVVINGYYLNGAQPVSEFRKLIDQALKETGGCLRARWVLMVPRALGVCPSFTIVTR